MYTYRLRLYEESIGYDINLVCVRTTKSDACKTYYVAVEK